MRRILIAEVNWLGDAIMTTPIFKALKDIFPSSYIGVMTVERVREVFEDNTYIDEIIIFDERDRQRSLFSKIKFMLSLKKKKFDTVFLIHRSATRLLICFLAGIKNRIGYASSKNTFLLTQKVELSSNLLHRQDIYLYLFEKTGIEIKNRSLQFYFPSNAIREKVKSFIRELKNKHNFIVGINPTANWELKRWPAINFAKLADRLIGNFNCAVVFIGAAKEKNVISDIISHMQNTPPHQKFCCLGKAYNFTGKTNLKELGIIMNDMDLFISNDSGPAHLAGALGVNTLVIFGPTSAEVTSPRGSAVKIIKKDINCPIPCYNLKCNDNACIKAITVEDVYIPAEKILNHSGTKP